MIVAVLFNSDEPKFHGYYGPPIRDIIFQTSVLQKSGRHMKVRLGDVRVLSHADTYPEYVQLAEDIYFSADWSRIQTQRLRATYGRQTIWAWVIQNITHEIADKLDAALSSEPSYLGLHSVDYSHPSHLLLYRQSLLSYCRILGTTCMLSYSMGEEESKDEYEAEAVLALGFDKVEWEDCGWQDTIFDDYDTLEHFQNIREIQKIFARSFPEEDYAAEEITMIIQDVNPKLFTILRSIERAISCAKREEDLDYIFHLVMSYFEQIAGECPSSDIKSNSAYRVTKEEFQRRAYACLRSDPTSLRSKNDDRLISQIRNLFKHIYEKSSAPLVFFYLAIVSHRLLGKHLNRHIYSHGNKINDNIFQFSMENIKKIITKNKNL